MSIYFVPIFVVGTLFGIAMLTLVKPGKGRRLGAIIIFTLVGGLAALQLLLAVARKYSPIEHFYPVLNQIDAYKTALGVYEMDNGFFPSTKQGMEALIKQPTSAPQPMNWKGPYLDPPLLKTDPWGHPYTYHCPGTHNPKSFDIYSLGPDGIAGTKDDIGNW